MKTIIIFISVIGFCFAEEPAPKPLPKDVQTIVDAREKALSEARIAFDKAVFKANDDAVKKMETVVKTNTQKGDLDGALASKKFVEEWNKEKETVAVTGALGGAGPKTDDLSKMIVGEWKIDCDQTNWHATITLKDDNTASCSNGVNGNWKLLNNNLTIKWTGMRDFVSVKIKNSNKNVMTGVEHNNNPVTMTSIK